METPVSIPNKWRKLLLIAPIVLSMGFSSSTSRHYPVYYNNQIGHILIQLSALVGGLYYQPIVGIPDWTLYGDGRLIFKSGSDNTLMDAQISADEVQQMLDVVVNQNDFFGSTQQYYDGSPDCERDEGGTVFTVNANGQHKSVDLFCGPGSAPFSWLLGPETVHLFESEDFLLNYQPAQVLPYVSQGFVVLVWREHEKQVLARNARPWSFYKRFLSFSLAQVAAQECPLLSPINLPNIDRSSPCPAYPKSKVALFATYDYIHTLLIYKPEIIDSMIDSSVYGENNAYYGVMVWPLMPDTLVRQDDGSRGFGEGRWPVRVGD